MGRGLATGADGAGAGAAAATTVAVGASAGGGVASGQTAQPMPASAKSAAPSAGSQRGVCGSGSGWSCAVSDMEARRIEYETRRPVKRGSLPPRTRYPAATVRARSTRLRPLASLVVCLLGPAFSGHAFAGPLAPLPGTATADAPKPEPTAADRLSRGIVTVERDGHVLAVGAVLSGDGDGRILTSLSALTSPRSVDTADVRYADGSVVHARIGHRDNAWDLALLVPLSGKWVDGLVASGTNPVDVLLQAPVAAHAGRPVVVAAHVRGVMDARAKDGSGVLSSVLDVELQNATPTLGAPITDMTGGVVGVFVKACQAPSAVVPPTTSPAAKPAACAPVVVAAPLTAIHDFLMRTPLNAVTPSAWLGIVGVPDSEGNTHGVRVMAVAPESPAQKGGLKASEDRTQADLIVAVDSQPVDTPERLAEIISRHAIGEHVKLLLLSAGKFHDATVALRAAP
jgi:S1-C subfamily serine protease